jgi:hypothetical protein
MSSRAVWARRLLLVVLAVALGYALTKQASGVSARLQQLSVGNLVAAEALLALGLCFALLAWRVLLADLGSPLPLRVGARIFFVGQLGKYVPGSVWPVVTQMQLGQEADVPRRRSAAAALLALLLSILAGLIVAAACAPAFLSRGGTGRPLLGLLVLPVALVACHPKVLNRLLAFGLSLVRQPPLENPLSGRAIFSAVVLSCVCWTIFGLQAWLLVVDVGGDPLTTLPYAVGGFALAAATGPLFVVLPAGAGVREAGLVLLLSPVLPTPAATTVALVSRLLFTVADAGAAGLAGLTARRRRTGVAADDAVTGSVRGRTQPHE